MRLRKVVTGALLIGLGAVVGPQLAMAAIDASNSTEDSSATSGDAVSNNTCIEDVGQSSGPLSMNVQDGDNEADCDQDADATSGDANSGQVVGQVGSGSGNGGGEGHGSSSGGGSSIVASSSCEDCESTTGEATANNTGVVEVGQESGPLSMNVQDGDNEAHVDQSANADSGDANSGQVIGQVS